MSAPVPKAVKSPTIKTINVDNWLGGTVTAFDDGRTPADGLRSSGNVLLEQDGTVRPRPSLQKFGPQPDNEIHGEIYQFRYVNEGSTTNWLISMQQVDDDTAHIFIAHPSDTAWTEITSPDYDPDARAHFTQLNDKVIIANGEDTLSYLDITTLDGTPTITNFEAISDPAAPELDTNTGLSGTGFNVWYAVTANSTVGETTGSSFKQTVSKDRSLWDPDTQSIKIKWTTVTGVQSWNVYCAVTADGDDVPSLGLLASGLDASTLSFTDNGSLGIAIYKSMPTQNSTAGPKASRAEAINGRLWLTGDKNNPYFVWHGGDPGHELDFTPANGGGYVEIGGGTREIPCRVWNFRSGQGDPQIKCLTKGLNGNGKRYTISSTTLTYGSSSFTVWVPNEDYGFSGTESPDGLLIYGNSTYYPSRDGFKVLGTKPQLQNLLSNDDISQTIQNDMALLNNDAMDKCVGLGFEGRLYWALPVGSDRNNQIWVLDLDRKGAWMKPWTVKADWMLLVQDDDGYSHHVILQNNTLYEFSYHTHTNDDGNAFVTSGATGLTYFSEDGRMWSRLIRLVIEVLRPQGTINFTVSGFTHDKKLVPLGTGTISATANTNGHGWNEGAWNRWPLTAWNQFRGAPELTAMASQDVPIKINKDVRYFTISWSSVEANTDYNISKIVAEYVEVGVKNLS